MSGWESFPYRESSRNGEDNDSLSLPFVSVQLGSCSIFLGHYEQMVEISLSYGFHMQAVMVIRKPEHHPAVIANLPYP